MKLPVYIVAILLLFSCKENDTSKTAPFNMSKDLLLVQFDCKTDVDDLHTVAAFATLLADSTFSNLRYHAVAGTYGIQEGLYVPPNDLFELAFGSNWTDAHQRFDEAIEQVKFQTIPVLKDGGNIWIAEAGQSDFTAALVRAIQADLPDIATSQRIHVVQHSDWNEKQTSAQSLSFVKKQTHYQKIADGNKVGNGTPGFNSAEKELWQNSLSNPTLTEIWQLSVLLSDTYNGQEGRYNNQTITDGGLDFFDLSEVCWILGCQDIEDSQAFFRRYGR